MTRFLRLALLLPLVLSSGIVAAADHDHHHSATSAPAPSGTLSLDLYTTPGRLHLLTAAGSPASLEYRSSSDSGQTWSTPVPVGVGQPAPSPIHRGMDAQIAASPDGKYLLAAWTTAGTQDRFGRGPIATARSSDSGRTWTPGPNPADDELATGHAFLDLACDANGSFHLVWLDGRDNAPGGAGGKGLRYARSDDHGVNWTRNKTLDPVTCECCWNTLLVTPGDNDGGSSSRGVTVSVLYRDAGPRDMALITSNDAGRSWSAPVPVGPFHWDATVCPHVGGGLALLPDRHTLFATVWTGAGDQSGAYLLSSPDAGRSWSTPVRLGTDRRAWHTDIAANSLGHLAAVWDARTDSTPAIFAITSQDAGRTWSAPVRLTPDGTTASHPRLASTPTGFRAFWTQSTPNDPTTIWTSTELP